MRSDGPTFEFRFRDYLSPLVACRHRAAIIIQQTSDRCRLAQGNDEAVGWLLAGRERGTDPRAPRGFCVRGAFAAAAPKLLETITRGEGEFGFPGTLEGTS